GLLALYNSFIDEAINRDLRAVEDDADAIEEWPPPDRRNLIEEIAYEWHSQGVSDWTIREFENFIGAHLLPLEEDLPPKDKLRTIRQRARFVSSCSFFLRIAVSDRFRFSHKSFLEYLVADLLVSDLAKMQLERWA